MAFLPPVDPRRPGLRIQWNGFFQQGAERFPGICDNRDVDGNISGNGGRIDINMYDGSIFRKFLDFAGDAVVEPGSDGEEEVTVTDPRIGGIASVDSRSSAAFFICPAWTEVFGL